MSTIKTNSIQPTTNSNNLIIKSGVGDVERIRLGFNGELSVSSGTTFSDSVDFSRSIRVSGGAGVGGAFSTNSNGGLPYTALDVVHTNASLLSPLINNYSATRTRSNALIRPSGSTTTLFFGNSSDSAVWLQAQASDNSTKTISLNPIGGRVGVGTTSPSFELDVVGRINSSDKITASLAEVTTGTTYGSSTTTLATKSYVDDAGAQARIGTTRHLTVLTNSSNNITSISGFNNAPCAFTISSSGGSLNVLIPSGYGIWSIRAEAFNTSSGALNAAGVVGSVYAGNNTSVVSLSGWAQTIMLTATRHT